jgi:protein phosphatase
MVSGDGGYILLTNKAEEAMHIYAWACSDIGMKRSQNQDAYLLAPELKLFAVADGMGGHLGGEVASDLAVRAIEEHVRVTSDAPERALADSVCVANARIHARASDSPVLRGMGTTTSSLLFSGNDAIIAHVGDSRVYLVRHERIFQLTEDHSLVFQQVKAGLLTLEQAKNSPYKHIIMRSVGVEPKVEVDVIRVGVEPADAFLLCSDGLTGLVEDAEICAVVKDHFLHRVPEVLVDLANERGGNDNITVVVAYAVADHLAQTSDCKARAASLD